MTETQVAAAPPRAQPSQARPARVVAFTVIITAVLSSLFGLPWWTLVASPAWPRPVTNAATALFALGAIAMPLLLMLGHGRRRLDWAAVVADALLGVVWVLFAWSALGGLARAGLAVLGAADLGRVVALAVLTICAVLLPWGLWSALRTPRTVRVEVPLARLAPGLDGLRVALLTDTHYGPLDRSRWSARVAEAINSLEPDLVCHAGDIADGSVAQRLGQSQALGGVRARLGRVFVTGNHEYFGAADEWVEHLRGLGWRALRNEGFVIERDGARLVVAGVDDRIAAGTGLPGHGADHAAALAGARPDDPILLLAHQPKQVTDAVTHGVDLQLSGHTHGGQIWPFHWLVRLDQPVVAGLSRHGERTYLYTSRGAGFWGPPFRIFAPSEITLLTLRSTMGGVE